MHHQLRLRDLPASINTNNAALQVGVTYQESRTLLVRPFFLRGDSQDKKQPRFWLAGYFKKHDDITAQPSLGFIAITSQTYAHLNYYSRMKKPAVLCPDIALGLETVKVKLNENQMPIIKTGSTIKNIGYTIELANGEDATDKFDKSYRQTALCPR